MAHRVIVKNFTTGHEFESKEGFSWTTLFFGMFVPAIRGELMAAVLYVIATICTAGLFWLIAPFILNGMLLKRYQRQGYKILRPNWENEPASDDQISYITDLQEACLARNITVPAIEPLRLTKGDASKLIDRLKLNLGR